MIWAKGPLSQSPCIGQASIAASDHDFLEQHVPKSSHHALAPAVSGDKARLILEIKCRSGSFDSSPPTQVAKKCTAFSLFPCKRIESHGNLSLPMTRRKSEQPKQLRRRWAKPSTNVLYFIPKSAVQSIPGVATLGKAEALVLHHPDLPPPETPFAETQVDRLFAKFGGVPALVKALAQVGCPMEKTTLYRWNYAAERNGRGGFVPAHAWPAILRAARLEGVLITAEDMNPQMFLRPAIQRDAKRKDWANKPGRKRKLVID
jgi:hypothetical protein